MTEAKAGDIVRVHYTGTLEDGTQFDSSYDRDETLEFTLDGSTVIPGFERAVLGMEPGESAVAKIPYAEAYGDHDAALVLIVARTEMPPNLDPQVGQRLHSHQPDGDPVTATITR